VAIKDLTGIRLIGIGEFLSSLKKKTRIYPIDNIPKGIYTIEDLREEMRFQTEFEVIRSRK